MSSFAKMQIDTMWKTKHLKTRKRLFRFLVDMFIGLQGSAVSRNGRRHWGYLGSFCFNSRLQAMKMDLI